MSEDIKHPVLKKVMGITSGVIACLFLFIPFFCSQISPFIVPSHTNINPDGSFDKYPSIINYNIILISLAYGISGFLMSFVVIWLSRNTQIRNVIYASMIVILFTTSNLLFFNSAYPNHIFNSHARKIMIKQIQVEEILCSVFLFISAIFGAWLFKKIYFSKNVQSKVNTVEMTT